jgi:hypothetical protein
MKKATTRTTVRPLGKRELVAASLLTANRACSPRNALVCQQDNATKKSSKGGAPMLAASKERAAPAAAQSPRRWGISNVLKVHSPRPPSSLPQHQGAPSGILSRIRPDLQTRTFGTGAG